MSAALILADDLRVHFPTGKGGETVKAVDGVSFAVWPGETFGVIGESGSGKSTLARVIAGLVPAARGTLELDGAPLAPALEDRRREDFRRIQLVFQDADTSLNPAHSVERLLSRPLALYHGRSGAAARAEVARLLDLVRLPAAVATRLPRELSGGQKQRVSLARALAASPDLLLCDEVTASLDTVVGAAILELLASLRRELGLAMIFISHDIANTREICDSLLVLYGGRRVQGGEAPLQAEIDRLAGDLGKANLFGPEQLSQHGERPPGEAVSSTRAALPIVGLAVGAVVIALVFYVALRVSLSNEVSSVLDRIAQLVGPQS